MAMAQCVETGGCLSDSVKKKCLQVGAGKYAVGSLTRAFSSVQ